MCRLCQCPNVLALGYCFLIILLHTSSRACQLGHLQELHLQTAEDIAGQQGAFSQQSLNRMYQWHVLCTSALVQCCLLMRLHWLRHYQQQHHMNLGMYNICMCQKQSRMLLKLLLASPPDKMTLLGPRPIIASISLGAGRTFRLRPSAASPLVKVTIHRQACHS